jgi:tRNA (guanine-N7-)-methyltransferase
MAGRLRPDPPDTGPESEFGEFIDRGLVSAGRFVRMSSHTVKAARVVRRPATTFKVRRRGLSQKRQAEFDQWVGEWGLAVDGPPLDLTEVFGGSKPVVLDVGFGHGESTIELAHREPALAVIGVEVHTPGVVTVLDAIVHDPLPDVRVVHGDLLPFLDRLGEASLSGVRIFFPDPWPKPRQHHRRLVRIDVVTALTDRLSEDGFLHVATDIDDYAAQIMEACAGEARLEGGRVPRPADRPFTRFEQRGLDSGRKVTDMIYRRRSLADADQ